MEGKLKCLNNLIVNSSHLFYCINFLYKNLFSTLSIKSKINVFSTSGSIANIFLYAYNAWTADSVQKVRSLFASGNDNCGNLTKLFVKLRGTRIKIKFVTNTTKESSCTLYKRLTDMSFRLDPKEIYSSLTAASKFVEDNNLNPFYLLSSDARADFPAGLDASHDSVVVGLAPSEFYYENLNKAFKVLMDNKKHRLIAIHRGKYYKRCDGLALGPGFVVSGLEYSSGVNAELIGKPNPYFFKSAIPENVMPEECVMIGDDATDDIVGAMNVGMRGILVKTGKYLPNKAVEPPPTVITENFDKAVEWIIKNNIE